MRKILASVLAATMVASMGVTAFAIDIPLDYDFNGEFVNSDGDPVADGDTYRTGDSIYGVIGAYRDYEYLFDKDLTKIAIDKEKNGKQIGKPELMTTNIKGVRTAVIKMPIIENWTDSEYKIELEMAVTAKEGLTAGIGSEAVFPRYDKTVGGNAGAITTEMVTRAYNGNTADHVAIDTAMSTFKGLVSDRDITKKTLKSAMATNAKYAGYVVAATGNATPATIKADGSLDPASAGVTFAEVFAAGGTTNLVGSEPGDSILAAAKAVLAADTAYIADEAAVTAGIVAFNTAVNTFSVGSFTTEASITSWTEEVAKVANATTGANTAKYSLAKGDKLIVPITFWAKNFKTESDDVTIAAGTKGVVVKPVKNEENVAEWEDNNDTIARLTFEADSSTAIYFPKLSTKWDNIVYAEKFNDQDAFVREFVSNPSISSTSRAVLELMVPYVNEDDELTIDEADIIVYQQIADGELVDVTSKGTIGYNDADELVFTMKTRELGTYIFAEMPVDEAAADEETAPAEKDTTTGGKVNPGTGA